MEVLPTHMDTDHLSMPVPDALMEQPETPVVIQLAGISKVYPLYHSAWDRLRVLLPDAATGRRARPRTEHRAVDNVSLTIRKGETIGLLGINGAGKSTLLQLITGTLTPTSGELKVDGRISALLELGAGFNPEWSGRRNAEFHCIMSGVQRPEIQQRIAAIEAFADIGDFFDQPARTYSSGMFLRVAFASAISTNPDILIVDEALAVGDVKFQNKCYRRFEELQAQGCTVLFVSHAPDLVTRFCTRGIILHQGSVLFDGSAEKAVRAYFNLTTNAVVREQTELLSREGLRQDGSGLPAATGLPTESTESPHSDSLGMNLDERVNYNKYEVRSGNRFADICDALIHLGDFQEIERDLVPGERISIAVKYKLVQKIEDLEVGIIIRSNTGQILSGITNKLLLTEINAGNPNTKFEVNWQLDINLLDGDYFIDFGISDMEGPERQICDLRQSAIHFRVASNAADFGIVNSNMAISDWKYR